MGYKCPKRGCGREFDSPRALAIHLAKAHKEEGQGPAELARALKALGIAKEEVLSFKVYDDRVVVIEGPGGKKRVWQRPSRGEVVKSEG